MPCRPKEDSGDKVAVSRHDHQEFEKVFLFKVNKLIITMNKNTYLLKKNTNRKYLLPEISLKFDSYECENISWFYDCVSG